MNHKRESHYMIVLKAEKDLDKPKKLVRPFISIFFKKDLKF